ncbi:unnamed protein product [Ceratitis capitata]|uniref:(Mediterranean fruit fly) hypothetical protein n=1 Tax=Ceratitis capitata TaxID=7213 RepID=A0A811U8M7_CERCA|nr:unnamed protein product [Ceratitis capitata]
MSWPKTCERNKLSPGSMVLCCFVEGGVAAWRSAVAILGRQLSGEKCGNMQHFYNLMPSTPTRLVLPAVTASLAGNCWSVQWLEICLKFFRASLEKRRDLVENEGFMEVPEVANIKLET